ncbi:MAG: hypothetical protein ABIP39_00080 [Polyangiaceae bacterium]
MGNAFSSTCLVVVALLAGCAKDEAQPPPAQAPLTAVPVAPPPFTAPAVSENLSSDASIDLGKKGDPVGINSCDAYLARIETCSRQIFARLPPDNGGALERILTSLEMMRRSWRNAELTPKGRASLAETCADSLRMYDSSVAGQCTPE